MTDNAILNSLWNLSILDIANGDGICTATLRSGVQLVGTVNKRLSDQTVLHLNTARGWHTIDYNEIAAITGETRPKDNR